MRPRLDDTIEELLADPRYIGHPLREALSLLWSQSRDQLERLERITRISDGFQKMARDQTTSLHQRYDRQLHKLEKAAHISDRYQDMMRDLNIALRDASTHDPLTGLANRRMLADRLKAETQRAERQNTLYSVAMLDIDHFKQVNDLHGHDAGDHVLVTLAKSMQGEFRKYDLCGRWGGEEFLILLPQTPIDIARAVIERVQNGIRQLSMPWGTSLLHISVSIGMTEHRKGESFSATVSRADDALLEAKQTGRDSYRVR